MKISKAGLEFIRGYEKLRTKAYLDQGGLPTIGYGNTHLAKPFLSYDLEMTPEQAEHVFQKDVEGFEKDLAYLLKVNTTQSQYDALVAFIFNIGTAQFSTSTLLKKLNTGDLKGASDEFLKWVHVKGKVSKGLTNRRLAERKMFLGLK